MQMLSYRRQYNKEKCHFTFAMISFLNALFIQSSPSIRHDLCNSRLIDHSRLIPFDRIKGLKHFKDHME